MQVAFLSMSLAFATKLGRTEPPRGRGINDPRVARDRGAKRRRSGYLPVTSHRVPAAPANFRHFNGMGLVVWIWIGVAALVAIVVYDLVQKKHAILRNFPIIGHFRYLLESIGPELRQYIVTSNDEELPFSRDQRRWVYASAKRQNNYLGFGTDNDLERSSNYLVVKHVMLGGPQSREAHPESADPLHRLPSARVLGEHRRRRKAFRPESVVNISGMSFGSLSSAAVQALNEGAAISGCLHNTGEGGIADPHLRGGELIWQIGTGYFGCRTPDGGFDRAAFIDRVETTPVRAIEIKLSQGAKPGLGGVLPAAKVSAEIARVRGVPRGQTIVSPASHTAFRDIDEMLDFVEDLAEVTGLPVGIKAAVGELDTWVQLAELMDRDERGVDFVNIDGGEGGTGAAPYAFADHVALPYLIGFSRVYRVFAERGMQRTVVWMGAGKLGFPERSLMAFGLGADIINVGREALLAIGCIQAQRCHTGHCPAGITTQNPWLMRGLDPTDKAARLANYIVTLRHELTRLSHACGVEHPALIETDKMEILDGSFGSRPMRDVFGYHPGWETLSAAEAAELLSVMNGRKVAVPRVYDPAETTAR